MNAFEAALLPHNPCRSGLEGVDFPAIPGPAGANLAAVLYQLEQSQWWSPERLRQQQYAQLDRLLRHAFRTVPFYRQRLMAAGYRPELQLDEALWSSLPLLTRAELQSLGPQLHSDGVPPGHGRPHPVESSGSTGAPVRALGTDLTRFFWNVITLRDHLWHRRDLSRKLAAIRPDRQVKGDAPVTLPSWGGAVDMLFLSGPSSVLNSRVDVRRQLSWLIAEAPDYLMSFPSNLRALVQLSVQEGARLPGLREVRCVGETVTPELRRLVSDHWGVPLTDMYSAQEVGYMALQCPEGSYHAQAETTLVEVLDAAGKPCAPGEIGRVVVTPLHNFASPLIRYEIMDYAEVGAPCPCGRGLPALKRVVGRSRNMAVTPDGRCFWPSFPSESWAGIAPVRQIQLVQTAPGHIEVTLAMEAELTAFQREQFTAALHKSLGHPYDFTFRRVTAIPRQANGKYEDFISRVNPT